MASVGAVPAIAHLTYGAGPSSITTAAVTTQASGSIFVCCTPIYRIDVEGAAPTDSKSNTYTQQGGTYLYQGETNAGVRVWACVNGTGGTSHTFTDACEANSEATIGAVEILDCTSITNATGVSINQGSANPTFTSPSIDVSGPSVLVCFLSTYLWLDADPAATGWTLAATWNGSGSSIQLSMFTREVSAAGTYNCVINTVASAQAGVVMIISAEPPSTPTVNGTQSPSEPQQTGANPFQNMNHVAAAQSPAQPRQIASALEVAIPTVASVGAFGTGTTTAVLPMPASLAIGDNLLALLESANQAVTVSDQAGGAWSEVTNSPQGTGTAGGTSATRLTAFLSRYNGTQTQPTFACAGGNHINGAIIPVRGCVPEGNPIHVSTGGVKSTSNTTTSIPGSTTTKPNCLIIAAVSRMDDSSAAHYSGWTNASLSNVTEILDGGGVTGNGGGIGACAGGLASAGTYGTTTATNATATTNGYMTFAFLGVESGTAVVASASESPEQPLHVGTLTQLTGSTVTGSQSTSAPSQTGTLQVPNTVTGQQSPAAATQTGTVAGSNSVAASQSTAQPAETTALAQTATVSGTQSTVAPSQTGTVLQPSVVTAAQSPAQPAESATLAWQSVAGSQSTSEPLQTEIVFQGSNVAATQSPDAPTESETLSQFAVAGTQSPAAALESTTLTQPSTVVGAQSTTQPSETGAALQTNAVTGVQSATEPRQLGQVAQAAVVVGSGTTTQPTETAAVVQGARVAGVEAPAQPAVTASISQPSTVLGVQQPAQPAGIATLVQTSAIVGTQSVPQPDQSTLLQQGSLVAGYQALTEPEQTGAVSQQYSVLGLQTTTAPSEILQLFATSRVDSVCVTAAPEQTATIVTYQPATVFAQQSAAQPSETCHVSPAVTLVRIRVSPIRSRAAMRVTLKAGEV